MKLLGSIVVKSSFVCPLNWKTPAPNTVTSEVQLWAPWLHPAPLAVHEVHNLMLFTPVQPAKGSSWAQRQLYCQNFTQYLAGKHIPDNLCVWPTGKGSWLWEMSSQWIPFTLTTLFSLNEQLWASWNRRTSLLQTTPSVQSLRQLHSYFLWEKSVKGGETNGFISHPAT